MKTCATSCLVLSLEDSLGAAFVAAQTHGNLLLGSCRFRDQGHGGFMGFHDWLRSAEVTSCIIGVRFWPHDTKYIPWSILRSRSYISATPERKALHVWFGTQRTFEPDLSGDQAFGLNRVLLSDDESSSALVLDIADLSPSEMRSLEAVLKFRSAQWSLNNRS